MMDLNIKKMRNWVMVLAIISSTSGAILTMATPQVASAADISTCNTDGFLGFPPWYRGLTKPNCDIEGPKNTKDGLSNFIWTIGLNVLQMALVLMVYIASLFFLYGGWLFIFSQGKPEGIAKGKSTMTMALIGLVISIVAVAFVNYVWSSIIKTL